VLSLTKTKVQLPHHGMVVDAERMMGGERGWMRRVARILIG
jgi:hypothetical protein